MSRKQEDRECCPVWTPTNRVAPGAGGLILSAGIIERIIEIQLQCQHIRKQSDENAKFMLSPVTSAKENKPRGEKKPFSKTSHREKAKTSSGRKQ